MALSAPDEPSTRGVELVSALVAKNPEVASLVTVSVPAICRLQSKLAADETLLEYYAAGERLIAFVMSRERVGGAVLDGRGINQLVQRYRAALQDFRGNAYVALGEELYRRPYEPVATLVDASQLTIVPHGALHYLPFSALKGPQGFLIEQIRMRVAPSASLLQFLNATSHSADPSLLVLGNPDLGDARFDLPHAGQEASAIGALFDHSRVLVREAATETALESNASGARVLHVASHGVFNPEEPLASGLLVRGDGSNDGLLTVSELYETRLDVDLVTLSACETAMGKVANGDDVVGFSRGFFRRRPFHRLEPLAGGRSEYGSADAELLQGCETEAGDQVTSRGADRIARFAVPSSLLPGCVSGDWSGGADDGHYAIAFFCVCSSTNRR